MPPPSDHAVVCASEGERIAKHFAFRNAIHEAARAAGLTATIKAHVDETSTRPGDIFIQKWIWGKDVTLDIIVVSPKVSP